MTDGRAVLLAHTLVVQVVTFLLRPATTYRAIELDTPSAWLGALSACFALAPVLLALPSGALADRLGERRPAMAGALLLTAAAGVLAAWGSVAMLAAGSVLLGLGHLCGIVAQQTRVANAPRRPPVARAHPGPAASAAHELRGARRRRRQPGLPAGARRRAGDRGVGRGPAARRPRGRLDDDTPVPRPAGARRGTAPPGLRGRAMSLRLVGNRAGQVVIPTAAGALAAGTGAAGVLCATAAGLAGVAVAARSLPVDDA